MRLKSLLKKFFLGGEIIEKINSSVNGEILVFEDLFGKKRMQIGGISQSGGLVESIWKNAFKEIKNLKFKIENCLILGLGCGDAAKIVAEKWPNAKIVGVEIDHNVIDVGKKYFGLTKIANLEIVVGDAIKEVQNLRFDLVLVDLYLGKEFPKEAESDEFLNGLKKILAPGGIVVFNRLNWGEYKKKASDFEKKLKRIFPNVWARKTVSNLLVFASQSASEKL